MKWILIILSSFILTSDGYALSLSSISENNTSCSFMIDRDANGGRHYACDQQDFGNLDGFSGVKSMKVIADINARMIEIHHMLQGLVSTNDDSIILVYSKRKILDMPHYYCTKDQFNRNALFFVNTRGQRSEIDTYTKVDECRQKMESLNTALPK